MPGTHPQNLDPRPKRRKGKDNPYEILSVGIGTAFPHYYLSFIDSGGTRCCIEIDKPLFDAFDRFELEDISYMNEVDRHYEHSEQTEASINKRSAMPQESVEEIVSRRMELDRLYQAIDKLPEKQRRRLVLYYFGDFTYEQIGEMEGCTKRAVKFSIDAALKNMKENF